eukprot:COSAG01_NODE_7891_length_3004_cov_2.263683_3_plen_66_part_00
MGVLAVKRGDKVVISDLDRAKIGQFHQNLVGGMADAENSPLATTPFFSTNRWARNWDSAPRQPLF